MHIENKKQHNSWQRFVASTLLAGVVSLSGCGSLSLFSHRAAAEDQVSGESKSSIARIMGPTQRRLRNSDQNEGIGGGTDADLAIATQELRQAKALFDEGNYPSAEKELKALVKRRRDRYETFNSKLKNFWGTSDFASKDIYDNFGDPIEEDALFLLAETQFAQRRYTKAQDSYDDLLNRYPSTRHMDRVTKQLFRVARYWLDFPNDLEEKKSDSKIQLASNEQEAPEVAEGSEKSAWDLPILPNLTDKTRPVYDADGRGLQALRSIWLHDATGPLADDSLMLAANHNLRTKNFVEAKRLYELLREQYPDSPHLRDAFLLGSHVTLASYEGPEYDGQSLEKARDLKQTMLQIFPDISAQERRMLQSEIDQLHDAEIARLWSQVEFYQRKNVPESIALHCNLVINRYPNSEYAQRARQVLQELEAEANRSGRTLWVWGNGRQPAPVNSSPETEGSRSADPRLQTEVTKDRNDSDSSANADSNEEKPKRGIFGFLRRAEEPPQLEPTPPPTDKPGRVSL